MKDKIIYHIDCNSAYLSWEAVYRLQQGSEIDLRNIPSIVGGNEENRHGIVLAKSIPAKKYKIRTGESVREAFSKCPILVNVPPNYNLYMKSSDAMVSILKEYSDQVQRFSVDESFVDVTNSLHLSGSDPIQLAYSIKDRIYNELGFTVNVGVSNNKLLAKMASDFKKPNRVHTLYPEEIEKKMWPLAVNDLFMVGRATTSKLFKLGIYTIGDLAKSDKDLLYAHLKSHGLLVWNYANGIEDSIVRKSNYEFMKGIGNGTTIAFDVDKPEIAYKVLLSLTESVGTRLREADKCAGLVSVSITTNEFTHASHQRKIMSCTDSTTKIYEIAKELFDELWDGTPIRKLRVRVSELVDNDFVQVSLYDDKNIQKLKAMDKAVDDIRRRFGSKSVVRACFVNSGLKAITGGVNEDDYPMMASIL
ncbi:DNA polymerase Y family protein [Vallitalea okinawensis]|uniref:DNA polymerase Y family protein n=1 Tax=Vallitalea okinawensis TaxID=2078660 RepID=UPI000CFC6BCE|nr:DNA polymerase IV [Vallitalea okinawensis]